MLEFVMLFGEPDSENAGNSWIFRDVHGQNAGNSKFFL